MRFRRRHPTPAPSAPVADSAVDIDAFARAADPLRLNVTQFVQLIDTMDMLGKVGTGIELAAMRTDTFVWFVGRASTEQLDHLMSHTHLRRLVFDEIFRRMTEHLDVAKAAALKAVVHWRIAGAGAGGYDRFETVIENGRCTSGQDPTADPRVTLTLNATDFLRAVTGTANIAMLFMRGRVKAKGDIAFAANLTTYFNLPKPTH